MATDRKAGQLILSQLKMLNESIFLLEETIEPAILEGIDASVESFAEKHDWVGEYTLATDDDCWLAPKTWISNPEDEDPEYKAWFAIDCIDGDKDYWVSLFCEAAAQGGRAGFRFTINSDILGGKNAWNAYAKKIPQELISKLTELGFQNLGKGNFFLPVKLDSEALGNSFLEYGKFSNDDDSFAPLLDAMEKLKKPPPFSTRSSVTIQQQARPSKTNPLQHCHLAPRTPIFLNHVPTNKKSATVTSEKSKGFEAPSFNQPCPALHSNRSASEHIVNKYLRSF